MYLFFEKKRVHILCRMKNKTNWVFKFCKNVQNKEFRAFFVKHGKFDDDQTIRGKIEKNDFLQINFIRKFGS